MCYVDFKTARASITPVKLSIQMSNFSLSILRYRFIL